MESSTTLDYKPWLLVIPPEASESYQWELVDFFSEENAKAEASRLQLDSFKAPYFLIRKECMGNILMGFIMSPEDVVNKFGATKKKMIDKHIRDTVKETVDEEDAVQYLDDIIYDIESDLKETLSEDDEKSLREYIASELKRQHAE